MIRQYLQESCITKVQIERNGPKADHVSCVCVGGGGAVCMESRGGNGRDVCKGTNPALSHAF